MDSNGVSTDVASASENEAPRAVEPSVYDAMRFDVSRLLAKLADVERHSRALGTAVLKLSELSEDRAALLAALKAVTEHMDRAGGDGYGMPECPWCLRQDERNEHNGDCELLIARAAIDRAEAK